MTLDQIAKQIGKNIKLYTDSGGWLTGRDVTEADIKEHVNYLYRDEMFPLFATQYPQDFMQVATGDSWIATATADAGLSGSTLTVTTDTFYNGMVDEATPLTVYNDTDGESTTITGFTDTKNITVASSDISGWSGDTIYVLGKEFILGGDAADIYTIEWVGTRYSSNDTFHKRANKRDKQDFYQEGWEIGSEAQPEYYLTTVTTGGVLKKAIGFFKPFENKVSDAIKIEYIAKPSTLGNDDSPILPVDISLVYGGSAWAKRQMGEHKEADVWDAKYIAAQRTSVSRYRPSSTDRPVKMRLNRRYGSMFNRDL